jgi:calcineurin-like phosphoesterase family protein
MDEYMISAWNGRVGENDDVYIAGDLIFRAGNGPETYLERLSGKKHLILGNHDRPWLKKISPERYFVSVSQMEEIALEGKRIILCHYPMMEWAHSFRGSYLVYGHIHNKADQPFFPLIASDPHMLNAGADLNGYAPVTFGELQENNRRFKEEAMRSSADSAGS